MNRFERIARSATLLTLPVMAGLACNDSETVHSAPTAAIRSTEGQRPYGRYQEIVDTIVNRFGGAIVFTAIGLDPKMNLIVDIERVDIPKEQRQDLDHDSITIKESGVPAIYAATSCKGIYSVSVSLDEGRSYTILPIPDNKTREPRQTFELQKDCTRPITVGPFS